MVKEKKDSRGGLGRPQAGVSIKEQMHIWANKMNESRDFPENNVFIIQDTEENIERLLLPNLDGSNLPWRIKVNDVGQLLSPRWSRKREGQYGDLRAIRLNFDESFLILNKPEKGMEYLNDLPDNVDQVRLLVYNSLDTVEKAIRQEKKKTENIEKEMTLAQQVVVLTSSLMDQYLTGDELNTEVLFNLVGETVGVLQNEGFFQAIDIHKLKIAGTLLKVFKQNEGEPNRLIARVRLRSVYLEAVKRIIGGDYALDKSLRNVVTLLYERGMTRWAMESALENLRVAYEHLGEWNWASVGMYMDKAVYDYLSIPRVRPYLRATREAAINLVGCREHRQEVNRKILGDELADKLFEQESIEYLGENEEWDKIRERLEYSMEGLESELREHEEI